MKLIRLIRFNPYNSYHKIVLLLFTLTLFFSYKKAAIHNSWIRINQCGYIPKSIKVAIWCSKSSQTIDSFVLINALSGKVAYKNKSGKAFGAYGPFEQTYRLDFTAFTKRGRYYLKAGDAISPEFIIDDAAYNNMADFCLRYMRQQRSGFNPFLNDSCHTHDGFTVYAPVPDGTHINVVGGWHDATDYLQYVATSANADYHLLAAARDFPAVFHDTKKADGLDGSNGIPDVLDEAKWGLDWLLKMNPKDDWMFNQLADDRDHKGMRIPKEDTNFYGHGLERPVYFCTGKPQGLLKYKNRSTGIASTAGKFSSAFALGARMFNTIDHAYAQNLFNKSTKALLLGLSKPGVCQTAPGGAPYFYEEDNWVDDIELAYAANADAAHVFNSTKEQQASLHDKTGLAFHYAKEEPVTPWLGKDTARHYQWYPFINVGHYELAKQLHGKQKDSVIHFYKEGIEKVWAKASQNAFYRGIPFIWCSNNLTVAFGIQCYWYRQLSGDRSFIFLEQACFDWIFGCNPWGTSMVYGLPAWGDTPMNPHSSLNHVKNYPIDGGLVDGPVYTSIYSRLSGVELHNEDAYAQFQSDLAVYHDDYGDYSTNEPTMDGTAVMIYLLAAKEDEARHLSARKNFSFSHGAIIRGDSTKKNISLVFTSDEFGDGLPSIISTLQQQQIKASFFFTGRFYDNPSYRPYIQQLNKQGNYLGPHSNTHLLYCDWDKRDSLLVTHQQFEDDMHENLHKMKLLGIDTSAVQYYIPPYEWWDDSISAWSNQIGLQVINFSPGTRSNADYTFPEMKGYRTNEEIWESIIQFEKNRPGKLNGFILLIHAGTDPKRKDKFYNKLNVLIDYLKRHGYRFKKVDELI